MVNVRLQCCSRYYALESEKRDCQPLVSLLHIFSLVCETCWKLGMHAFKRLLVLTIAVV